MSRLPLVPRRPEPARPGAAALPAMAANAVPATVGNVVAAHNLLNNRAARLFNNGLISAGMAAYAMDSQVWEESLQLQTAVMQRLQEQNDNWLRGCAVLMQDYVQIKQANTMAKLVEKQFNLVTQWSQLLTNQATDLIGLLENIEVDYGYWVSQKVRY